MIGFLIITWLLAMVCIWSILRRAHEEFAGDLEMEKFIFGISFVPLVNVIILLALVIDLMRLGKLLNDLFEWIINGREKK